MNDKFKSFTQILSKKFGNKKNSSIILVLGICGMILIGFSDFFSSNKTQKTVSTIDAISLEDYIQCLEKRVVKMLNSVEGAGKCKIMITAENSSEKDFATDDSIMQDSQQSTNKTDIEKEIVMIEDSNGKKQALIKSVKEPKIRGVLILCEGADNPNINEIVTNAVKTLLGISSNKISVIKMK